MCDSSNSLGAALISVAAVRFMAIPLAPVLLILSIDSLLTYFFFFFFFVICKGHSGIVCVHRHRLCHGSRLFLLCGRKENRIFYFVSALLWSGCKAFQNVDRVVFECRNVDLEEQ